MPRPLPALALFATLGLPASGAVQAAEKASAPVSPPSASQAKATAQKSQAPVKLIDINSASKEELKTLPGISDAEADRIIKARPYPSKAKLAVDKVITDAVYAGLQGKIVAVQAPAPKKKSDPKAVAKP